MATAPDPPFALSDLRVFDAAHLRQAIALVDGAVSPALAARALCPTTDAERTGLLCLAERIERALPPDARIVFGRQLAVPSDSSAIHQARADLLDQLHWDLTYWATPTEYERLTAGEQIHLGALDYVRPDDAIVLDVGAGAGRITLPLARRARHVYAIDPAPPLLRLLEAKLAARDVRNVELLRGYFARVPLPDASVDAVVACSAFGTRDVRGGDRGLNELRRVTRPGGRIVVIWPEDPGWLVRRGFHYAVLPGPLTITFPTLEDALQVARRFYGAAALRHLEATNRPELPFRVLGHKEPRDLCWLTVTA